MKEVIPVLTLIVAIAGCATGSMAGDGGPGVATAPLVVTASVVDGKLTVDDRFARIDRTQAIHFQIEGSYRFDPVNGIRFKNGFGTFGDGNVDLDCPNAAHPNPNQQRIVCLNRKAKGILHSYDYGLRVLDSSGRAYELDPWINNY